MSDDKNIHSKAPPRSPTPQPDYQRLLAALAAKWDQYFPDCTEPIGDAEPAMLAADFNRLIRRARAICEGNDESHSQRRSALALTRSANL